MPEGLVDGISETEGIELAVTEGLVDGEIEIDVVLEEGVIDGATEGGSNGIFVKAVGATVGDAVLGTDDGANDGLLVG